MAIDIGRYQPDPEATEPGITVDLTRDQLERHRKVTIHRLVATPAMILPDGRVVPEVRLGGAPRCSVSLIIS